MLVIADASIFSLPDMLVLGHTLNPYLFQNNFKTREDWSPDSY